MRTTKYTLAGLSLKLLLSNAFAQTFPSTFPEYADYSVKLVACPAAYFFRVLLLFVPVVFLLYVFSRFLFFRKREFEPNDFTKIDDLLGATIVGFMISFVIRLIYETMQFWGVPIRKMIDELYANMDLYPQIELPQCVNIPGKEILILFLSFSAMTLKAVLFFIPIFAIMFLSAKRVVLAFEEARVNHTSLIFPLSKALAYVSAMTLFVSLTVQYSLSNLYIDYQNIVRWGLVNLGALFLLLFSP